jgi:hypothetical protein
MNICTSILFLSVIFLQLHPKVVFQMVDRECSIGKTIGKTKLIGSRVASSCQTDALAR